MKARTIREGVRNKIVQTAKLTARIEANSACILIAYQPEKPKELKKLRKF